MCAFCLLSAWEVTCPVTDTEYSVTQSTQVNDLVESCQLYVPCCIGHCLQISKSSFLEEKSALIFQVVAPEKSIKEVLIKPNQGAFCLMIHVELKKKKKIKDLFPLLGAHTQKCQRWYD